MRRPVRSRWALLAAVCCLLASLTACGLPPEAGGAQRGLLDLVRASGELRIGHSPDFPPMEYLDPSGNPVGADVDLGRALAEQMGLRPVFLKQPFAQLINSVRTLRVDIVLSGLSDTAQRQQTLDFVDYFGTRGRLYTLGAKASQYTSPDQACGKTVAVSKSTDYFGQVQAFDKQYCGGAGRPAISVLGTDSGAAARLQLQQGRADLAVQGEENLVFFRNQDPNAYIPVLDPLPAKPFAVAIKTGEPAMTEAVYQAFTALVRSGRYKEILDRWQLGYAAITPTINGVKN